LSASSRPLYRIDLVDPPLFHRIQWVRTVRTPTYTPPNEPAHHKIRKILCVIGSWRNAVSKLPHC
ncbi:hypothetical protein T10_8497, partial [Trichinella papuae]